MNKLRQILDATTSYRVVLYALSFLVASAFLLSGAGILKYSSFGNLALSFTLLSAVCFVSNQLLSRVYGVTANHESSIITTMILFFVLAIPTKPSDWAGVALAGIIAIASKYVLTWRSANIFNPAAIGVLIVSIIGVGNGAWWIADKALFVPMLIAGVLVLMKIRRFQLFFAFLVAALLLLVVKSSADTTLTSTLSTALTLYPILFLGTIMLTEPFTMPRTRNLRIMFGVIVGLVFASNIDFGFIATSPHLALVVGNIFALIVSPRASARLKLVEKEKLTPTTYAFSFESNQPLKRSAGQYIELTLPNVKLDSRGNRRTFTISSSPSNKLIKVGVKFYENGSQFKQQLMSMKIGDSIIGNHIAGDFILPKSATRSVVFVAGGIGITPFISMIEDMIVRKDKRQVDLYYFASDKSEVAYKSILKTAQNKGMNIHLRVGKGQRLSQEDLADKSGADFYLSGPPGMVNAYNKQLQQTKVRTIHTDLFTGY